MFKKRIFIILFIFTIAFSLRLCFIFEHSTPMMSDELNYDQLASSIVEGKGFADASGNLTAARAPGYPLFLSIMYFLFGKNYFLIRLIQAVIDSLLCILIYYLGTKTITEEAGILAGFLASAHIGFIAQSAKFLTEGLSTFLFLLAMVFFYQAKKAYPRKTYYILSGVFMGIVSLVRPTLSIIPGMVLCIFIYDFLKKGFTFKQAGICLTVYIIAFLAPILPWTVRNYKVFRAFVPTTTTQGIALYTSYHPLKGKIYGFVAKDDTTKKAGSLSSEAEQSRFLTQETIKLIKRNPSSFFKLLGLKMAYLFSPFDWELIRNGAIYNYLYAFYLPFFVIGSFALLRRFNELSPLYLPVVNMILTSVIFFGIPRFRIPIEPYMIILSSAAIINIYERISRKKLFVSFLSIFLLGNLLLYLNSFTVKQICKIFLKNIGLW